MLVLKVRGRAFFGELQESRPFCDSARFTICLEKERILFAHSENGTDHGRKRRMGADGRRRLEK